MRELFKTEGTGKRLFLEGKNAFKEARELAEQCDSFDYDVEEELYTDDGERSCYNCLYRRWTKDSFSCQGFD